MPFIKHINMVETALDELRSKGAIVSRTNPCDLSEYPISIGEGKGDGIVLRSDTLLELGGPFAGSVALTLQTTDEEEISSDEVLLVGNDIEETDKPIPFGQIIMISGEDLTQEDYLNLIRVQSRNGYIEGHMVKSTGNNIWLRISNSLGSKGFDLKFYGSMLIDLIKSQSPNVKNVQVIFITSAKDDLKLFHAVAEDAKETYQSIKEKKWSKKGVNIYDCAFHGNCASCSEKNVCSEINKIAENKKKTG